MFHFNVFHQFCTSILPLQLYPFSTFFKFTPETFRGKIYQKSHNFNIEKLFYRRKIPLLFFILISSLIKLYYSQVKDTSTTKQGDKFQVLKDEVLRNSVSPDVKNFPSIGFNIWGPQDNMQFAYFHIILAPSYLNEINAPPPSYMWHAIFFNIVVEL